MTFSKPPLGHFSVGGGRNDIFDRESQNQLVCKCLTGDKGVCVCVGGVVENNK